MRMATIGSHLNTEFPGGETDWEGLRGVALLEEVCYRLLSFQELCHSQCILCFLLVDQNVNSQLLQPTCPLLDAKTLLKLTTYLNALFYMFL